MPMHPSPELTTWFMQILVSLFLAILFLQSGIDKIVDRRGNLDWLTDHFAKSPLASTVESTLLVMTILETTAGVLSGVGCLMIVFTHNPDVGFWGAVLAALALSALFFGQRVAKDYTGAAVLVPYFLLALAGIWILGGWSSVAPTGPVWV